MDEKKSIHLNPMRELVDEKSVRSIIVERLFFIGSTRRERFFFVQYRLMKKKQICNVCRMKFFI